MNILGISAFYHDSAASLISDASGSLEIIAAAQEERFTRKKYDESYPARSIEFCLKTAGLKISDLDAIVYYDKPWITFERLLESYMATAPRGLLSYLTALPPWLNYKLNLKSHLKKLIAKQFQISKEKLPPLLFSEHHLSHAAAAYYASPYDEAAVLCMDGVGEWATTTLWKAQSGKLTPLKEIQFPHSLGLLYSAFTSYCGFKVNSGEYKLMGLAPYGEPKYKDIILKELIDVKEDGSFQLNMDYFSYVTGFEMTSKKFKKLFPEGPRHSDNSIRVFDMDMASSIQAATEEIVLKLCRTLKALTGSDNLCLAGGVALNCVANGKILEKKIFQSLWVQPAAGDAGSSLGCALAAYYLHFQKPFYPTQPDLMKGALLGPRYEDGEIEKALERKDLSYQKFESPQKAIAAAAKALSDGHVLGFFQGAMEFGPRALGSRSIVGDPRVPEMQKKMNLKIKFRESFRPFAPAVLATHQKEIFDLEHPSPYMLIVAPVLEKHRSSNSQSSSTGLSRVNDIRSRYPSITHVDYSARIQSVSAERHPDFYELIQAFQTLTGCPLVINTSYNVRGEPIVESPDQAIDGFIHTEIDTLCIGSYLVHKRDQKKLNQNKNWRDQFEQD